MAKIGGLGRGLEALIEDTDAFDASSTQKIQNTETGKAGSELLLDPELLKPNPHQPRKEFESEALQELSASIQEHGIIQPIIVEEVGDGTYYIIAGERRTRAARLAGLKQVPVVVKKFSEERKLEVALIENIQRENLNPIEEAQAYHDLMVLGNLSQEEVATRVGKNRSTVANSLRLLKLPEDMSSSLSNGAISAGHARAILSVVNPSDQRILFGRIIGSGLSVRDAERMAQELNEGGRASSPQKSKTPIGKSDAPKSVDVLDLEQKFIDALGTKVSIKGDLHKGILEVSFFSSDDLERILSIVTQ